MLRTGWPGRGKQAAGWRTYMVHTYAVDSPSREQARQGGRSPRADTGAESRSGAQSCSHWRRGDMCGVCMEACGNGGREECRHGVM